MQMPRGIDVGFMEVSCRFPNMVAARRPLNPTDVIFKKFHAGSIEICCGFHGGSMCVLKVLPQFTLVGFIMHSD